LVLEPDGKTGGALSRLAISCALAALLALPFPLFGADPPKCKLLRIAEWPVRLERNLPILEGTINGKKVGILLDTGAFASVVTTAAAETLNLVMEMTRWRALGVGGESRVYMTRIDELRIGDDVQSNLRVRVTGERPIPGVDFILGDDFLSRVDLEFDYSKGVVRLYQPRDCKDVSLAYWDPNALQVPMEPGKNVVLPVSVNGRPALALLDSGASSSVVSVTFAATLGITPQSSGVVESGCSSGIGQGIVHAWVARFDSVSIAGENIRDARLRIGDFLPELSSGSNAHPEVILGTDFLRSHRVLVARSQGKVYFSYAGGLIFPTTPALACEDRPRGGDPKAVLASYDETLAKNPNDVRALVARARLRARGNDQKGALSDLDAAIRIEPNNAVALEARAGVRAALGDNSGALADSEAAINNGMRNAQAHVRRGDLWRVQGDYQRALEEYDEALRLDPNHQGAMDARARARDEASRQTR
jgi:predicted aspartyl protease